MSILLLHGFTGHPSDLSPLKSALENHGFTCHAPLLPGHGNTPEDLNKATMEDWLECIRSSDFDVVIGLSMGGLLGTILAEERPLSKLVLLSPAFYLQKPGRLAIRLSKLGVWSFLPAIRKLIGSDILDPSARVKSQALSAIPLKALLEFERVRLRALQVLPQITCPVYSFFGNHDRTVDVQKSSALFKNPVIFKRSAHILPVDYDQKELIAQCLQILEK
jgi:carboxylesterase